jgi:transcriptional regulator with XRE-family HTH domain
MAPASASLFNGTPDGAAFGEFLRQARERRGLTLQQISSETKIPFRHLDALEHGLLNDVPGGPYRRGEIRAYAEVVGLDKTIALERLDRALQASVPVAVPQARMPATASRRGYSLLLVALIAIAAAVLSTRWGRAGIRPSSEPARPAPLAAGRILAPATAMPLPIVLPDTPTVAAAFVAADGTKPLTPLEAELTVTSEPAGARVTVDGIARGVTPVTVRHVSPGDRRVRVTLPDFVADERSVRIPEDRSSTSLHVVLTAAAK